MRCLRVLYVESRYASCIIQIFGFPLLILPLTRILSIFASSFAMATAARLVFLAVRAGHFALFDLHEFIFTEAPLTAIHLRDTSICCSHWIRLTLTNLALELTSHHMTIFGLELLRNQVFVLIDAPGEVGFGASH